MELKIQDLLQLSYKPCKAKIGILQCQFVKRFCSRNGSHFANLQLGSGDLLELPYQELSSTQPQPSSGSVPKFPKISQPKVGNPINEVCDAILNLKHFWTNYWFSNAGIHGHILEVSAAGKWKL